MMPDSKQQYELVFGQVDGAETAYEYASGSARMFVRSQFQIAFDSAEATGTRMAALEALQAFGWNKLLEVGERGAARLSPNLNEVRSIFKKQLENLRLDFDDVASSAKWPSQVKSVFLDTGRAPIKFIQMLAPFLGFDERSVGSRSSIKPDPTVAYRMRMFGENNIAPLSSSLKVLLIESSWIIERQHRLLELLVGSGVLPVLRDDIYPEMDSDYGGRGMPPWGRGFALAHALRDHLKLSQSIPIVSMRNLIEDDFRIPVIMVNYNGNFAGATIQTNGYRGIVVNVSGNRTSALTRRTTLAHELCHILFDAEAHLKSLHVDFDADMSDYLGGANDKIEKRANAFAVEFLAPHNEVRSAYSDSPSPGETVLNLAKHYGISVSAVRQHIANEPGKSLNSIARPDGSDDFDDWKANENSLTDYFPVRNGVPSQRLGAFAYYVSLCHQRKLVSTDSAASMLGCETSDVFDTVGKVMELYPGSKQTL